MYTHVVTGCTKFKNVQNCKCTTTCYRIYRNWKYTNLEMYKLEMYKICKCTATYYRMYNHLLPNVQKKLSKPVNMGSSFENLDARSSKMKTVRNLDQRFWRYFILKFRFCNKKRGKTVRTGGQGATGARHVSTAKWRTQRDKPQDDTSRSQSAGFPSRRKPFF